MHAVLKTMIVSIFIIAAGIQSSSAQSNLNGFVARYYREAQDTIPYRLFIPKNYDKSKTYPLVLWLHGANSSGSDNVRQITGDSTVAARFWTKPESQSKYPAFVFAPQCPTSMHCWDSSNTKEPGGPLLFVLKILDTLKKEFSIDSRRIYVAGQSMGGYGTWDLVTKRPDLFAAAVPLCGGGSTALAPNAAKVAIWAFHGAVDETVSVNESRNMITAIRKAGGSPKYTEYRDVDHDVWNSAFLEPDLLDWVFAQRK
jgi:predicted peptidase